MDNTLTIYDENIFKNSIPDLHRYDGNELVVQEIKTRF
jgi:hypothetical protein